jgi:hypothetical protein
VARAEFEVRAGKLGVLRGSSLMKRTSPKALTL